jgi:tRNA(Ile)-lysidine synthase
LSEFESDSFSNTDSVAFFEEDVYKCLLFLLTESSETEASTRTFLSAPVPQELSGTRILIALSGGIDSSALLLALAETRDFHGLELHAAHFNHQLRGAESQEDLAHCERLCGELDIPLLTGIDSKPPKQRGNPVSEDALRRRRYAFLEEAARAVDAHFVLTGHNLDDQAETILFRLLRGTALSGMRGIQPFRQLAADIWLIRPMLAIPRAEIARYILSRQITAREDSSNLDGKYTRNFIRQQIMPVLKERFPAALRRIENFACTAGIDEDYLNNVARQQYEEQSLESSVWQVDTLKPLHQAILDRIVATGLLNRQIEVSTDLIESIRKQIDREFNSQSDVQNARFSIDKKWDLIRHMHHIQWLNKEEVPEAPDQFAIKIKIPGSTIVLKLNKALQVHEALNDSAMDESSLDESSLSVAVDLSKLNDPLVLRRRAPGDTIQPTGRQERTSLKKYLHRRKASQSAEFCRARVESSWTASHCLVLASGNEVYWIPGIGLSEKLRVTPGGTASHMLRLVDLAADSALDPAPDSKSKPKPNTASDGSTLC